MQLKFCCAEYWNRRIRNWEFYIRQTCLPCDVPIWEKEIYFLWFIICWCDEIFACHRSINGQVYKYKWLNTIQKAINCALSNDWKSWFLRSCSCSPRVLPKSASYALNYAGSVPFVFLNTSRLSDYSAKSEADCRLQPFKNQLSEIIFDFFLLFFFHFMYFLHHHVENTNLDHKKWVEEKKMLIEWV